jgi:hypothetical protein
LALRASNSDIDRFGNRVVLLTQARLVAAARAMQLPDRRARLIKT